jgi:hypothetical protein
MSDTALVSVLRLEKSMLDFTVVEFLHRTMVEVSSSQTSNY